MSSCRFVLILINRTGSCFTFCMRSMIRRDYNILTASLPFVDNSVRLPSTALTIFSTALAYFFPCSPSKTTPDDLIMLNGAVLDSVIYPRTVRCEDSCAKTCSSSGGGR